MKRSWTDYFFDICDTVSKKSKDPSTKVGAVAIGPAKNIISTAFNGLPMGVSDSAESFPERYTKPDKYLYVSHAEANIVALAARHGIKLEGATLFCNLTPCIECTKLIIQSGIKQVHYKTTNGSGLWRMHLHKAYQMFTEAGVLCVEYNSDGDIIRGDSK